MDEIPLSLKDRLKGIYELRKNILNPKFLVYLFFVAIATFFWFLNALSKEYTTILNYPVRYYNFPENKVLMGKLPNYLEIKVNAYGFTLLRYKYMLKTSFKPIEFNVKSLGLKTIKDVKGHFYLLTRYEQAKVSSQLKSDLKLIEIYPDTIYFRLAEIVTKKVKIYPNIKYDLDKQTMLNGFITLQPDSIQISGPQTIIDTIDSIPTKFNDFEILSTLVVKSVGLEAIDGLKFNDKKVDISIPAEKFTEASIKKEITVINLPDSLILKPFPTKVDISYQVALSNFDKITDNDFLFAVDYNETKNMLGNKLKVSLLEYPGLVKKVKFFPTQVEYIIERK